ncbi:MAG: hypothetical protein AB8B97_19440 [Granulosicoccus sp.]
MNFRCRRKNHRVLFAFAMLFLFIACSSDDEKSNTGSASGNTSMLSEGNISSLGFLGFRESVSRNSGNINAYFLEFNESISAKSALETFGFLTSLTEDSCELEINSPGIRTEDTIVIDGVTPRSLTAGEVILVSSPAGSFVELKPGEVLSLGGEPLGFTDYSDYDADSDSNTAPLPYPMGLTIDIPGDEFPSFSSVAVPDVEPFVLISSRDENDSFGIFEQVRWEAREVEGAKIVLYVNDTYAGNNGQPSTQAVLNCVLIDDGSFFLDIAMQELLTEAGILSLPLQLSRVAQSIRRDGDTMLLVTRSSGLD